MLLHDLGKGLTPSAEWPSHKGHEGRGVALVDQVSARLKAPAEHRALARAVAAYHLQVHDAARLRPVTVLRLIEAVDGFRRPERFLEFLAACEADARGRLGLEDRPYPQAQWLRAARDAAAAASGRDWAARGLAGDQIRERLRAARIDLIAALKTDER